MVRTFAGCFSCRYGMKYYMPLTVYGAADGRIGSDPYTVGLRQRPGLQVVFHAASGEVHAGRYKFVFPYIFHVFFACFGGLLRVDVVVRTY